MKRLASFLSATVVVSLLNFSPFALAQRPGRVVIPASNLAQPGDAGVRAHTNLRVYVPNGAKNFGAAVQPKELPPFPGYFFETPASLACVYRLVPHATPGCNPNVTTGNPSGGSNAIAIVDAFDDPTAVSDLAVYSAQFGLPAADLTVVYAQGTEPPLDPTGGFELEESLDIEQAHALAPHAKIYLIEAQDNSYANLFQGVTLGASLVAAAGGGEVSMSFGGEEFTEETSFDSIFTTPGIVYFASAGDSPGAEYPSASPNVVSAGGTSLSRNATTGNFFLESTWQDAGGGPSQVEPRPAFQNVIRQIVGDTRGTPDISFDANPNTGVWVFDSNPVEGTGWFVLGGTSVSAPSLAAIVNAAGHFHKSSQEENTALLAHSLDPEDIRDIRYGNCGLNISNFTTPGWDFCSGVGSPQGYEGK